MPTDERSSTTPALDAYLEALERAHAAWLAGDRRAAARDAVLAAATLSRGLGAPYAPFVGLASALQDLDHGSVVKLLRPAEVGTSRLSGAERYVRAVAVDTLQGLLELGGTVEDRSRLVAEAMAQAGYPRPNQRPLRAVTIRKWRERRKALGAGLEPIWGGRIRAEEERQTGCEATAEGLLDRLRRAIAED